MSWNIFSSSAQVPKVVMLWWLVRGVGRAEGRSDALLFGFVVLLLTPWREIAEGDPGPGSELESCP